MMPLGIIQTIFRGLDRLLIYFGISPLSLNKTRPSKPLPRPRHNVDSKTPAMRPLDDLKLEIVNLFALPCNVRRMQFMSSCLRREYLAQLQSSPACMLPSFCHALPTGQETGTFVAMDVGGSTFRVALVELSTRSGVNGGMNMARMSVHKIDETIRRLPSKQFFDWMASKIQDMVSQVESIDLVKNGAIPLGLAWSFPIEQTSHRGGKMQFMGKGFRCHEGSVGQDLGGLIESACQSRGLTVRVDAIVNDSSATLLSQAYSDPATSMALILGTGTNAAVYLPVFSVGTEKLGERDASWFQCAEKVIVNTELSMFGKGILPETRWDETLNRNHPMPDFQPLEYMTTGRYLGEILRLIMVEATSTCGLFNGTLPDAIGEPYSLDTALLAAIEKDNSANLSASAREVEKTLGLEVALSRGEMTFLRAVAEAISRRAAAYIATALHALWSVQKETEVIPKSTGTLKTSIASNGSVVLKYPGFRSRCQDYIAQLISAGSPDDGAPASEQVILEPTMEAAVLGAAVAVAIADAT